MLAADAAEALGLVVPSCPTRANRRCWTAPPRWPPSSGRPRRNGNAGTARTAIRILQDSGEVDALLVVFAATRADNVADVYAAIGECRTARIPIVVNCLAHPRRTLVTLADGRRLPVFLFPETAIRALGHAVRCAEWQERPQGVVPDLDRVDAERAGTSYDASSTRTPTVTGSTRRPASELLGTVGIAVQPSVQATSQHQALEAAGENGPRWR